MTCPLGTSAAPTEIQRMAQPFGIIRGSHRLRNTSIRSITTLCESGLDHLEAASDTAIACALFWRDMM